MSRIGYSDRKHPYELQLRKGRDLDYQGLENKSCLSLNLQEGKITEYHTDEDMIKTEIREYIASDEELEELYSFLTMEAIEEFESMSGTKKEQYATGYYDCAVLKYFLIGPDGKIADGSRGGIYSNDPINMTCEWVRRIFPYWQHTICRKYKIGIFRVYFFKTEYVTLIIQRRVPFEYQPSTKWVPFEYSVSFLDMILLK